MNDNNSKHIMLVDDTPANLDVLRKALEAHGYIISIAPNGELALELAPKNNPDLILLDVMMPGIDGFETCSRLKENKDLKDIPIIFLTGKTNTEDISQGYKVGGADYVTKPFFFEEVVTRVQSHLKLSETLQTNDDLIQKLKETMVQLRRAQENNIEKKKFLNRINDEIITPLNSIIELSGNLSHASGNTSFRENKAKAEKIFETGKLLLHYFDEIIEFYASEISPDSILQHDVNLSQVIRQELGNFETPATQKQIALEIHDSLDLSWTVSGDPTIISALIRILIDNGIRYNAPGGTVVIESGQVKNGRLVLNISSSGDPIPDSLRETIFEPFYRLPRHTNKESGIGLGLALGRKYARILGGSLTLNSHWKSGNCFCLELPLTGNSGSSTILPD